MGLLRIFAIDDEQLALRRIELLVSRFPNVELTGAARSVDEALALLPSIKPDVILLDIKMAGQTGFDLVEALPESWAPLVIFVTAFDHFAARAFEVSAVDYIVKPVEQERLRAALDKARHTLAAADAVDRVAELRQVVSALREQVRPAHERRFEREIWAERRGEYVAVKVADIDWVEAERDYVRLHTATGRLLLRETMANMEGRLDPEAFMRIRRSAMVRRDRVTAIRRAGYGDFRVVLSCGQELRAGRTYVQAIRSLIGLRVSDRSAPDA